MPINKIKARPSSLVFVYSKDSSGFDTLVNPKEVDQNDDLYSPPSSDAESFEFYRWHLDYQSLCISQMEWCSPHSPSSKNFESKATNSIVDTSQLLSFIYNNDSQPLNARHSMWEIHDNLQKQMKKNRLNKHAWDQLVEEIEKNEGHLFIDHIKLRDEVLPWERQIHEINLAKEKFYTNRFTDLGELDGHKPWDSLISEAKSYKAVGQLLNQTQLDLLRDEIMPWENQIVEMQSKEFDNPKDATCPWNQLIGQVSKSLERRGKKLQQEDIDKLKDEVIPWEKQIASGIYVDSFSPTSEKFPNNSSTRSVHSRIQDNDSVKSDRQSNSVGNNSLELNRRDSRSSSRYDPQPNTKRLSRQYQNLSLEDIGFASPKEVAAESPHRMSFQGSNYDSVWKRASTLLLSRKRMSIFNKSKNLNKSKPRCKSEVFITNDQILKALSNHIFPMADKELNVPQQLKDKVIQNIKEGKLDPEKYMDFVSQVYLALKWQSLPSYSFYRSKWSRVTCTRILLRLFTLGLDK